MDILRSPHFCEKHFLFKIILFYYLKSKRIWQISLFVLQIWALQAPVPCDVAESKYVQFSDDEPPQVSVTENDKLIYFCSIILENILLIRHVKGQIKSEWICEVIDLRNYQFIFWRISALKVWSWISLNIGQFDRIFFAYIN